MKLPRLHLVLVLAALAAPGIADAGVRVVARDQAGVIGEGRHRRAIVDRARFMASVARKARMVA